MRWRTLNEMPSILAYLAPIALLLPLGTAGQGLVVVEDQPARLDPDEADRMSQLGHELRLPLGVDNAAPVLVARQVRIERRVTIRIAPQSRVQRQSLIAELPQPPQPLRYEERKIGKCLAVSDISAVRTGSGNRLVLLLSDRRMVSAKLEKSCRAREFVSGFYLERHEDGMLCVERDKLQSRAGANCELTRIRELVPIYD